MENKETAILPLCAVGLSFWNIGFESFASNTGKDIDAITHKAW
jgi:hypothetical protein